MMIKTKAIRKIFITTLTMFIILTVFSIPSIDVDKSLRVNLELEEVSSISTNNIETSALAGVVSP